MAGAPGFEGRSMRSNSDTPAKPIHWPIEQLQAVWFGRFFTSLSAKSSGGRAQFESLPKVRYPPLRLAPDQRLAALRCCPWSIPPVFLLSIPCTYIHRQGLESEQASTTTVPNAVSSLSRRMGCLPAPRGNVSA